MLSSSFDRPSPDHVETDSVADTSCMNCCHVVFLHVGDNLDDFFGVEYLPVRDQDHISDVLAHLLLDLDDVEERGRNFSSSEVSIKVLDFVDCLLHITIIIGNAGLEHSFELAAETDDIVYRILRKRLQEQDKGLFCLLDSASAHGTRSVKQKDVLSFVCVEVGFG
jgi:hypothetical protein